MAKVDFSDPEAVVMLNEFIKAGKHQHNWRCRECANYKMETCTKEYFKDYYFRNKH